MIIRYIKYIATNPPDRSVELNKSAWKVQNLRVPLPGLSNRKKHETSTCVLSGCIRYLQLSGINFSPTAFPFLCFIVVKGFVINSVDTLRFIFFLNNPLA